MSRYVFERTRDKRVYQWCHLQTSVWRKNLSAKEYVERERHLAETRLCDVDREPDQQHGIHYWILRDTSIAKDESMSSEEYDLTFNIVASCETLHRKSWKFIFEEDVVRRIDVISPCIGAVHTIEAHRGKGVAGEMIKQLGVELEDMLGDDNFITLYSEIGYYYDKFDYKRYEVPTLEFPISEQKPTLDSNISFIKFDKFDDLITIYSGKFLKNVYQQMGADTLKKNRIALVPTVDIIEWHHARSNFISQVITGEKPGNFGVQIRDDHDAITGFIVFSHNYHDKSLYLFMVYAIDFDTLKKLLDAVQHEAHEIGYKKITSWESDFFGYKVLLDENFAQETEELKTYIEKDLKGTVGKQNGSVSAVRMLDENNDIEWHGNGKWAWF